MDYYGHGTIQSCDVSVYFHVAPLSHGGKDEVKLVACPVIEMYSVWQPALHGLPNAAWSGRSTLHCQRSSPNSLLLRSTSTVLFSN